MPSKVKNGVGSDAPIDGKVERPPSSIGNKSLWSSVYSLSKSAVSTPSFKTSSFSETMYFYINHSILILFFIFISILRNFQYIIRRTRLRFLTLAYNPSKTPQIIRDDVNKLSKIPRRLACILDLKEDEEENGGLEGLINDFSEIVAWTISAGIPTLSIYEYTGVLKNHLDEIKYTVIRNLKSYYGSDDLPSVAIIVPHLNIRIYSDESRKDQVDLTVSLLSHIDSKPTIVELTKTMGELALHKELSVKDITIGLIDEELASLVGVEPDLLIMFGPIIDLEDYPPWHIRLTELFWEHDNYEVNYAIFLRALQKYSTSKVNVGR